MYLKLNKLIFRNAFSYGAKNTEVDFTSGLIHVKARNGCGKSSIINILTYCLFGKPYTKIKVGDVVNWINKKDLYTECQFEIGSNNYKIIRTQKPDSLIVEKNNEKLETLSSKTLTQDEIDKLLGIDYNLFRSVISLAVTNNKPFLTNSLQEKREIVESIFNVRIFSEMLKILKKKISLLKVDVEIETNNIKTKEEMLTILKAKVEEMKNASLIFEENKTKDIQNVVSQIEQKEKQIESLQKSIDDSKAKKIELEKLLDEKKLQLIEELKVEKEQRDAKVTDITKKIKIEEEKIYFETQRIEKQLEIDKKLNESNKIEEQHVFDTKKKEISDSVETKNKEVEELRLFLSDKKEITQELQTIVSQIKSLTDSIVPLKKRQDSWKEKEYCIECESTIPKTKKATKIKELQVEIDAAQETINALVFHKKEFEIKISSIEEKEKKFSSSTLELLDIRNKLTSLEQAFVSTQRMKEQSFVNRQKELQTKIVTLKENSPEIVKLKTQLESFSGTKILDLERQINTFDSEKQKQLQQTQDLINSFETNIENSKKEKEQLTLSKERTEARRFEFNLEETEKEFNSKCEQYKLLYKQLKDKEKLLNNSVITSELLSDKGIKAFFFKKLIPILNQRINFYLNKFDLPVSLNFNELLEEDIRSFMARNQSVSYYSFSGGERTRIDISILLSFVDIMKSITNFSCNVLTIDELFDQQIDDEGLDAFVGCIKELSENNKNLGIYIISHKLKDSEVIDKVIEIEKVGNFSKIKETKCST